MKGFMQWFQSSNKMKRWMFLILVGILLACYGLAKILVMKEISFEEVRKSSSDICIRLYCYCFRANFLK